MLMKLEQNFKNYNQKTRKIMMKILNKLLLLSATCLLSSNLFAQDTVCFKNNIELSIFNNSGC